MKDSQALHEQIYLYLRNEILDGRLRIGERLKQQDLARKMNVSRMPVREALKKLEKDGLVTSRSSYGVRVSFFDTDYLIEVYLLRKTLEKIAVELAVPRMDENNIEHLKTLNLNFKEAVISNHNKEMIETNEKFHFTLYSYCGFEYLQEILKDLWNRFPRYTFDIIEGQGEMSFKEHDELLYFALKGEAEKAGEIMKKHIENAQNKLISKINKD